MREYALQEQTIFNRGHYSEIAYGRLWRGGSPFSQQEKRILDLLTQQNMVIIFACPPLEILRQRYQERNFSQQIKFPELGLVRQHFCDLMKDVPNLLYQSTSYQELQSLLRKVVQSIQ